MQKLIDILRIGVLGFALTLIACQMTPRIEPLAAPGCVAAYLGNEDLRFGFMPWQQEADRRYDDFVLVMVHGDTSLGVWMAVPDFGPMVPMIDVVMEYQFRHPGKRIVLVSCNADGLVLPKYLHNVSYATAKVYVFPDAATFLAPMRPGVLAGDISEFIDQ